MGQVNPVGAPASGAVGTVFTAEVPVGAVQIYVDGVQVGAVDEGADTGAYSSPGPDDVTFLSTEGCPDSLSF